MTEYKQAISPKAHIAKECVLAGNVTIGDDSSVFYYSALRGDMAPVIIKRATNIQENCSLSWSKPANLPIYEFTFIVHFV